MEQQRITHTTLDIEEPILQETRDLQQQNGRLEPEARPLKWPSKRMGARIDLSDKDAVYAVLGQVSGQ